MLLPYHMIPCVHLSCSFPCWRSSQSLWLQPSSSWEVGGVPRSPVDGNKSRSLPNDQYILCIDGFTFYRPSNSLINETRTNFWISQTSNKSVSSHVVILCSKMTMRSMLLYPCYEHTQRLSCFLFNHIKLELLIDI